MRRVLITGLGSHVPQSGPLWNHILNPSLHPTSTIIDKYKVLSIDPLLTKEKLFEMNKDFPLPKGYLPSFIQYGLLSTWLAIKDSGISLEKLSNFGISFGNGLGNPSAIIEANLRSMDGRRISPKLIPSMLTNMPASWISMVFGCRDLIASPSNACATGTQAIGDAYRLIKDGYCDSVICGASEAPLNPIIIEGFRESKALSPKFECKPFDSERDGFLMSEGSATLILEDYDTAIKRDIKNIYCEIIGYGNASDSYHTTLTHPLGEGAYQAMKRAVLEGRKRKDCLDLKVSMINAHGTGTIIGDESELRAINSLIKDSLFMDDCIISSQKGQFGHLLGASGALEAIITAHSLCNNYWPGTLNTTSPIDRRVITNGRFLSNESNIKYAISNSFGFGGVNTSLLFKSFHK